jgi:3-hydroxyanthranilate 3,4-dioxygenase
MAKTQRIFVLRGEYDRCGTREVSRHRYNGFMTMALPFNLLQWIEQNRGLLKPPVGNKLLFDDSGFIVMAVGGPNSRKDFHHDPSEELFLQIEGTMTLKTVQDGKVVDIPIRAGEIFLLPREMPHSPRRPAGTVGIVVEKRRSPEQLDGFSWYCENCGHQLYLERVPVGNIETELPAIFERFYSSLKHRTCSVCGTVMQAPS